MASKRIRTDGQVTRNDYNNDGGYNDYNEEEDEDRMIMSTNKSDRRILEPKRTGGGNNSNNSSSNSSGNNAQRLRLQEYHRNLSGLNAQLSLHLENTLRNSSSSSTSSRVSLIAPLKDYLSYVQSLKNTYLPTQIQTSASSSALSSGTNDGGSGTGVTEVYTWGSGDCGQCGHGISSDSELMVAVPRILTDLTLTNSAGGGNSVVSVACGGLHNAAVSGDGEVYTWGCNDEGSVGRVTKDPEFDVPGFEEFLAKTIEFPASSSGSRNKDVIISVSCGDCQSIAVSITGSIYFWGAYKDREGKQFRDIPSPSTSAADGKSKAVTPTLTRVSDEYVKGGKPIEVQSGSSFNVARLENGGILTWGLGEVGELGRVTPSMKKEGSNGEEYDMTNIMTHHLTPRPPTGFGVGSGNYVTKVAAGAYHLLVVTLTTNGTRLFTAGLNNYGQLGLNDHTNRSELTCVPTFDKIGVASVDGGMHHSLVIDATISSGLWAFGRGDSGQLGTKDSCDVGYAEESPVRVPLPPSLTLTSSSTSMSEHPVTIKCGANHNLLTSSTGSLYTWGYGDMLALGHGKGRDENKVKKVEGLTGVVGVAGGGQHSVVVCNV